MEIQVTSGLWKSWGAYLRGLGSPWHFGGASRLAVTLKGMGMALTVSLEG